MDKAQWVLIAAAIVSAVGVPFAIELYLEWLELREVREATRDVVEEMAALGRALDDEGDR